MVVLFMVLKDDTINQTMLVPMDLSNLIPEGHPCYFIKNVVGQIDCSEANKEFFVISLVNLLILVKMLLRIGLDECYLMVDCLLLIERRTRTEYCLYVL